LGAEVEDCQVLVLSGNIRQFRVLCWGALCGVVGRVDCVDCVDVVGCGDMEVVAWVRI
jgi:hypothetical protein